MLEFTDSGTATKGAQYTHFTVFIIRNEELFGVLSTLADNAQYTPKISLEPISGVGRAECGRQKQRSVHST